MDDFASSGVGECANYPMVHHITDATVIQVNKPGGDHLESRAYFSGKHKLYCLKVEASVYPNGEVCNWTAPAPGAKVDITMFRENFVFHKRSAKKSAAAMAAVDHGERCKRRPKLLAILLDKGYIGVKALIR